MRLQIFQGWLGKFTADFCGTWPEHQQASRGLMYSHYLTLFYLQRLYFWRERGPQSVKGQTSYYLHAVSVTLKG